jgi:hypothetical protein
VLLRTPPQQGIMPNRMAGIRKTSQKAALLEMKEVVTFSGLPHSADRID